MDQLVDFFKKLLDSSDWPPRWHCGRWTEFHGWLYIISDLLIWSAYFTIPIVIIRYIVKKHSVGYSRLYVLFAAFILACGATHFLDAVAFWLPLYRLNALFRFITGVVSWVTVFYLIRYLPAIFSLKSQKDLEVEISLRIKAEKEARQLNETLEKRIVELDFQSHERQRREEELIIANKELAFQISERKKAEVHIAHLASIVEFSEDAIISQSLNGTISSWNKGAERMFRFTETETAGKSVHLIIPPEYVSDDEQMLKKILNNDKVVSYETVRNRKNGERFNVSLTLSPLKDQYGNIIGVSNIARDITIQKRFEAKLIDTNRELKKVEKQLNETNKELEAFSYSVSHDLRVPLRAISGYSGMLKEDYGEKMDSEANRLIDVIVDKTKMMAELIDNLLTFSKMARLNVVTRFVDMKALAQTCMTELLQIESNTKYTIAVLDMPECSGDASMLKQVWYNLIGNALKYSSKNSGATIEIGALNNETIHVYYVKDNGAGFEMKYAKKLFGVFQRLHRQDEFEGTGVGLALVKRIVTKHGGEVWAESILNEGSTFYFSIPKTNL